jgi:SAM-dependent methyltransferase
VTDAAFWDARYSEYELAYGDAPNDFLREQAHRIPRGRVLCLAEGQGRNALHLAALGYDVTAMDQSTAGLARARKLAAERGLALTLVAADLNDFVIEPGAWQGIVATYAHLPPELRARVHRAAAAGLAPGGVFILEAYTPAQLANATGGPRDASLLMTLDALRAELAGLELLVAQEIDRDMIEGQYHRGPAAVVQVVGRKGGA